MCSNRERQQIQNIFIIIIDVVVGCIIIIIIGVIIIIIVVVVIIIIIHLFINCHRGFHFSEHAPKTSQDQSN